MSVLFCYDGPIYKYQNHYYTVSFTDEVLNRYRTLSNQIVFAVRVRDVSYDKLQQYTEISNNYTEIIACENMASIKNLKKGLQHNIRIISACVKEADYIVVRMPSLLGLLCSAHARKNNKQVIAEVVTNSRETLFHHSTTGKIVAIPLHLLMKRSILKDDFVIYITEQYLQSVYPTKGKEFICTDVNIDCIDKKGQEKRDALNKKNGHKNHYKIGSTGSVSEKYKGHEYVIKAMARLIKKGYDLDYYIIGGGDSIRLQKLCEKKQLCGRVHFLGKMPHKKVIERLDDWDFYVQPSLTEAQGRSLIEAMSRGCICISSDVGGMKELLPKEMRFKKKRYEELERLITSIINMGPEQKANYSKANIEKASEFEKSKLEKRRSEIFETIKTLVNDKGAI